MVIPVSLFIAAAVAIFSYSQGQGGPVAGVVYFGILFLGVLVNVTKPYLPSRAKR
jgi:hypothetical protein